MPRALKVGNEKFDTDTQREPHIVEEMITERMYQAVEWSQEHDDKHTPAEWVALIVRHSGMGIDDGACVSPEQLERFRRQMIRVGALTIAIVASLDRQTGRERVTDETLKGSGW